MNSKVIYTCITGGYDELRQPRAVADDFDYVCFTDGDLDAESGVWQLRPMPCPGMDNTRKARYVKLQPDKVFPEYECSVWLDANVGIEGYAFYNAVNAMIDSGCPVAHVPHLFRDCTYEETLRCFHDFRIGFRQAFRQICHLKRAGFPRRYGLYETNVLFRRHNHPDVVRMSAEWWDELSRYTRRDQLSIMYVYWKNGFHPALLLGEGRNARNSDCLSYHPHSCLPVSYNKIMSGCLMLKRAFGTFFLKLQIPRI